MKPPKMPRDGMNFSSNNSFDNKDNSVLSDREKSTKDSFNRAIYTKKNSANSKNSSPKNDDYRNYKVDNAKSFKSSIVNKIRGKKSVYFALKDKINVFSFKDFYKRFTYHPNMHLPLEDNNSEPDSSLSIKDSFLLFKSKFLYKKNKTKENGKNVVTQDFIVDDNLKFDIPIVETKTSPISLDDEDKINTILLDKSVSSEANIENDVEKATSFAKYVESREKILKSNLSLSESIKYISSPINNVSNSLRDSLISDKRHLRFYKLKKIFISFIVVLFLFLIAWIIYGSSVFALHKNEIVLLTKSVHVEQKNIQEALTSYDGLPLPRLSVSELESVIETKFVWIKKASVSRQWPNGIAVTFKEREGVAVAKDGDSYVLLDSTGVKLEKLDKPIDGVPLVTIPLGDKKTKESLNAILNILGTIVSSERAVVVQAMATDKNHVEFELQGGIKVIWGNNSNNELKAKVLEILRSKQAKVIDVSTPSKPVTIL